MAKNPFEIPPQTPPSADAAREEAQKLYEEEIERLKNELTKTREGLEVQRGKKGLTKEDREQIMGLENEMARKEYEMRQFLSGQSARVQEEVTSKNIEELRKREQERRAQKQAKKQKKKEEREKGKGVSLEELRKKQFPQAPEEQEEKKEEKEKEPKYPWEDEEKIQAKIKENEEREQESSETLEELQTEIDALSADYERYQKEIENAKTDAEREAALKDFERTNLLLGSAHYRKFHYKEGSKSAQKFSAIEDLKHEFFDTYHTYRKKRAEEWDRKERLEGENQEEFEILEVPEEEFAPLSRAATPKEKKESLRSRKERMLKTAVKNLARHYEEARNDEKKLERVREAAHVLRSKLEIGDFKDMRNSDDGYKAIQLYREISDTMESLQKAVRMKASPTPSAPKTEIPPIETGQTEQWTYPHEVEPRKEPPHEPQKPKFQEPTFEELPEEERDRLVAKHYNFDGKKINEAIEEAKKIRTRGERSYRDKIKTIEMLERVKALIEKESGIEATPPVSESQESGVPPIESTRIEQWSYPEEKKIEEQGVPPIESDQKEEWTYGEKAEETKKEERKESPAPPASPRRVEDEASQRGEPETKAAIEELLGEELKGDAQMREAAAAVVEARRAMRGALATRKEERLYIEAGAGFIAPEKLQEAAQTEKAYEDALVGLSARLRESAQNNEAFLVPYLNIQNAEAMRIAQMREAALTPERGKTFVRLYQRLNNPFNKEVPPRWARYVRVGLTAAALGGGAAALGGAGAVGIFTYAGWRMGRSLAYAAANGIARSGIDVMLTHRADTMMKEEKGRQRTAMQEALRNNERIEALQESLRASIRGFQSEAVVRLENRKFYGRAATFGLMGLGGLISYEFARPSAVAADEGAFGGHIATNEDMLRQRFYETTGNVKEPAGEIAPPSGSGGFEPLTYEEAPMGPEFPEAKGGVIPLEGEPPSTLVTPKLGPSIYPEESTLVEPKLGPSIYPEAQEAPKAGVEEGAELARPLAPETSMVGPSPEDIERLSGVVREAGKTAEKIAVIPKGSSVWETAMDMKRHGIMTTEQFNEAWEKSMMTVNGKEMLLRDAWLVHEKDALRFVETPQGPRLEFIDAKDAFKAGTYKELGEAYDALGKEKPPALREALAQERHLPSEAKQLEKLIHTKTARPAIDPSALEEIKNASTAKAESLAGMLDNPKSYIGAFEKASLADQEATIHEWERTLQDLRNLKGQPNIDQAFLNDLTKTENLLSQLQKNEAYLGNLKAWGEAGKFWSPKLGLDANEWRTFTERWTVEKFLRAAEEIKDHEFKPTNAIERALRGRIGAVSDLEGYIAAKLGIKMEDLQDIKKIPRGLATKPLGRILKNTL